jgi:hypothetical protein
VGVGVACRTAAPAGAFDRWALEEGILPKVNEEQAAVLMSAFVAGYRHAMAINEAELEIVQRAGYDVFRAGGTRIRGGRPGHRAAGKPRTNFNLALQHKALSRSPPVPTTWRGRQARCRTNR